MIPDWVRYASIAMGAVSMAMIAIGLNAMVRK